MNISAESTLPRVKSNPISFLTDLGVSTIASLACVLIMRYKVSAVPEFDHQLTIWLLISLVASSASLLVTRVNKIVLSQASIKDAYRLVLFLLLKALIVFLIAFFVAKEIMWETNLLQITVIDLASTGVLYTLFKLLLICYYSYDRVSIESAVKQVDILIYGTGFRSIDAASRFSQNSNYRVVGFLTRDSKYSGQVLMGFPVFYITDNALPVKSVSAILFTEESDRISESAGIISESSKEGIFVLTLPQSDKTTLPGLGAEELDHQLDDQFIVDNMSPFGRVFKRLIDFFFSCVLILILSPLMLVITTVMIVKEGRPVLYRQERIGRFGRPFYILKYRSMKLDAEDGGPALYSGDDDPRLTKLGRFLRIHHLDELPQLFNVFTGDMSFVGYRPERKVFIKEIIKHDSRYSYLYQIRPGVTSYATLKNGYTDTMEKMLIRLKYDLYYLNHRSLMFDVKVIFDTVINVMSGKRF